jgi:uncharacterized protein (TIRG00374 family)
MTSAPAESKITPAPSGAKVPARFLLRLTVTVGLFALILWQLGPSAIVDRLQGLHAEPLALSALLLGTQFVIYAWRWKRIVNHVSAKPASYGDLCRYLGASNFYGQLLPSTVGGDLVRTAMLARRVGLRSATLSVLIDRITGLAILIVLVLLVVPVLAWRIGLAWAVLGLAALGLGALGLFVGFLLMSGRTPPDRFPWMTSRVRTLARHTREALTSRRLAPTVIGCGALTQLGSVTLIFVLARAVGVPLAFVDCLLLVPPALLISALPVSLGGWGIREGALAGGFALIGVPPADVVTVSILYGLTAPAIGAVYGIYISCSLVSRRGRPESRPAPRAAGNSASSQFKREAVD